MRYFYAFMEYATEFELSIAKKAPVQNKENIKYLNERLAYWTAERDRYEVRYV